MMFKPKYERIVCQDGASVSIQANQYAYCEPRDDFGPYSQIEAGYPSVMPPISWMEYADCYDASNPQDLLDTVYGYMPIMLVHEFIDLHGGMISGELPPFRYPDTTPLLSRC